VDNTGKPEGTVEDPRRATAADKRASSESASTDPERPWVGEIRELRSALIEQEHRPIQVYWNFLESFGWHATDPRRKAARRALLWRMFAPAAVAAGGITVASVLSILTYAEFRKQNAQLREQTDQIIVQAKVQRDALDLADRQLKRQQDQWEYERGAGCGASDLCKNAGVCTYQDGLCVASEAGCKSSRGCEYNGACLLADSKNTCTATVEFCRSWSGCKKTGLCDFALEECTASANGCAASDQCKVEGLCALGSTDECIATDEGCAASDECKESGRCRERDGQCVPTPDTCKRTAGCRERGECFASLHVSMCMTREDIRNIKEMSADFDYTRAMGIRKAFDEAREHDWK
jgi:hypothetical protein